MRHSLASRENFQLPHLGIRERFVRRGVAGLRQFRRLAMDALESRYLLASDITIASQVDLEKFFTPDSSAYEVDKYDEVTIAANLATRGANLTITAKKITLSPGLAIDTAASTAGQKAGSITFDAPSITVADGSSLLANGSSDDLDGDITLKAINQITVTQFSNNNQVLNLIELIRGSGGIRAHIDIGDATTIQGGDVSITSDAGNQKLFSELGALDTIFQALDYLVPTLPIAFQQWQPSSTITLGGAAGTGPRITGSESATVEATAQSHAIGQAGSNDPISPGLGSFNQWYASNSPFVVGLFQSHATASITLNNSQVSSGGDVRITTDVTNEVDLRAQSLGNNGSSNTSLQSIGLSLALSEQTTQSTIRVDAGSLISSQGDVIIRATADDSNSTVSKAYVYGDGTVSLAPAFSTGCSVVSSLIGKKQNTTCDDDTSTIVFVHMDGRVTSTGSATEGTPQPPSLSFLPAFHLNIPESRLVFEGEAAYRTGDAVSFSCSDAGSTQLCTIPGLERDTVYYVIATQNAGTYDLQFADSLEDAFNGRARSFGDSYPTLTVDGFSVPVTNTGVNREGQHLILFGYDKRPDGQPLLEEGDEVVFAASPHKFVGRFNAGALVSLVDGRSYRVRIVESEDSNYPLAIELLNDAGIPISVFGGSYLRDSESGVVYPISDVDPATGEIDVRLESLDSDGQTIVRTAPRVPMPQGARLEYHTGLNEDSASLRDGAAYWAIVDANNPGVIRLAVTADQAAASNPTTQNASPYVTAPFRGLKIPRDSEGYLASNLAGSHFTVSLLDEDGLNLTWHTFVFLSPGQDSGDEGNTNVPNNSHSDHIPIRLYYDKDQVLSVDTTADRIADALNALGWGLNARRLGSGTGEILVGTQSNLWFGLIDPNETNKAHLEEVTLQVDLPVDNFEVGTGLVFQQDTELIDGLRVVYHAVPGKPVRGLVDGRAYHVYNVPNVNLNEAVPQTILTLMNAVEASSSANGGVFDLVVTAPDGSVGTATGIAWNAAAGDVADAINRLSLPGVSVSVSGTGQIGSPWLIRGLNVGEVAVGPSTLNASGALVPLTIVEAAPGIRLGHTATEGTFSLEIMAADGSRGITSPIAWNASAAQVEALIAALNLAGTRVTVEGVGSFAEPWVLRGLNPSQVTVGMIDLRRHGESPEVRMTSNLQEAFYRGQNLEDPSGTQYLVTGVDVNKGTVTVRLPDSAPLDSADASLLTGSLDRPARVETRDIAAGAIQMFSFATGGTFTITVEQPDGSRSTTTAIAHDASPEAVAAALNALPAVGVTVTGLGQPLSPWLVTGLAYEQVFVESDLSGLEGDAMDVTMVEAVGPVHQVWLDNATGGTFTLSLRAAGQQVTTGPLSFDITLDRLNAALNALPHVVARVTGSGTSRDPWLLTSASQPVETGDPLVFRDNWDMLSMGMLDGGTYYAIVEQSQGFDPYSLPLRIAASLQDAMSTPPRPIEMRPYLPFSPAAQTPFSGAGVVLATQDAKDVPGDGVTIEASLNSSKKVASYTQLGGFPLLSYLIGGTKSALSQNTLSLSSRFTSSGGASGAVAMQWVSNDVHVTLGRTARVAAAENVVIQSSIEQELSSVSNASLSKTQKQADGSWGVAVALAASIVDNNSHAVVSSDAIVTAGKMLEVDSSITYQGRDPWRHVLKSIGETVINLLRNDRGWLGLFFNNVANVAIPQPVELGKGQIYARYFPGLSSNFQMTLVITASIAVESLENNNLAQIADGAQINDPDQTFEVIDLETGAVRFIRPPVSPAENGVTVHATTSVIQRGLTGKIHLSLPLLAAGKFRSGPSLPWAPFQKASESALGGSVNVFTVQGSNQALLGGADLIGGAPSHAATVVHFGDRGLTVQAETLNGILQLAQSGANSSKFSLEASVATVSMTGVPDVTANNEDRRQRTYAKIITSNLPVTLRPLANTAGDLNVLASDRSNGTAIAGSFLVGQAVGFGVSASVITLNRDVQASIGSQYASFDPRHLNQAAQAPGSSIVVNGAVNVDTDVNGAAVPLAVVGSFSSQVRDRDSDPPVDADPKPDSSKLPPGYLRSVMMAPVGPDDLAEFLKPAPKVAKGANVNSQEKFQDVLFYGDKKSEGKWGFLFSGDFAGAFSDDAAYSYINLDGSLTGNNAVSEDLAITSDNRTKNFALGGSVAIAMHSRGESTKNANVGGVSGSVAWNSIESDVRSTLEGASVAQFHDLNVAAENEKRVFGGSAGLKLSRAADNIVNVAGSVAINDIANTTIARIDDATVLLTGDLLVEAFSRDSVSGFAGQADLQSNVSKRVDAVDAVAAGVGMALALNQVEATTVAEVSQSRITQGGSSTRVVAEDFTELSALSLGVSVQVSSGTTIAVEGSFTINSLAPNTSAVVDRSTIRNLYQGENPRELLVSATLAPILKATAGTFELQLGGDFFQGAVGMSLVGQYIGKTVRDAQESFKTQALIEGSSIQGFDAVDVFAFTGDLDDDTLPYVLHQADSELATDEQRRNVKALALAGALQIGTAALSLGMVGATVATTVGIDTLARITSDEAGVASRITGLDEVQEVGFATTSAPTAAGTFTLDYDGAVTTPLRATATAAQVQSALEALASVGSGNVRVEESGEGALNRRWTITFTNDLGGKDVPQVTIQTEGLGLADVVGVERTAVEGGKVQAELQVQAINQLTSKTDAGGATVTFNRSGSVGSIAVGGAVNNYNSFNTTRSLVDGDTVVRGQSARISALLAPSIDAFAVGVAITGSKSLSLGLSGGVLNANLYDTAEAGASNSRLNLLGDLTVAADDRSVVDVDAGNISGAYAGVGSGAVGMVSSDVRAHHTVLAWLGNRPAALRDADGNPIGDTQSCGVNETPRACSEADRSVVEVGGTLTVHADASQTIHNSLVGVAVSASAKVAVAAGGAWGRVSLENIVRSAIHGVPHLSVAGGDQKGVSVLATIGGVDYPKNSDQDGKVTVKVGQVAFAGAKYGGTAGLSVGLIENHDFVNAQVEGSSLTLGTASSGSLLDVSAINRRDQQSSVWVTSVVAALGGIAGAGGKSVVDSQAKVIAEVGQGTSILFHANAPRGDVSVHAQSDESIEARLLGVVGASVGAVGIFHARAEKHGSAWAGIGTVGEFHVDDLTVQALGSHDVFTNTVVADGAALAISEGEVSDIYDEQLSAVMGRNYNDPTTPGAPSQITADGDVRLTASTLTIAHSGYKQFELAGTGVGAVNPSSTFQPVIHSTLAYVDLEFGGSLDMEANVADGSRSAAYIHTKGGALSNFATTAANNLIAPAVTVDVGSASAIAKEGNTGRVTLAALNSVSYDTYVHTFLTTGSGVILTLAQSTLTPAARIQLDDSSHVSGAGPISVLTDNNLKRVPDPDASIFDDYNPDRLVDVAYTSGWGAGIGAVAAGVLFIGQVSTEYRGTSAIDFGSSTVESTASEGTVTGLATQRIDIQEASTASPWIGIGKVQSYNSLKIALDNQIKTDGARITAGHLGSVVLAAASEVNTNSQSIARGPGAGTFAVATTDVTVDSKDHLLVGPTTVVEAGYITLSAGGSGVAIPGFEPRIAATARSIARGNLQFKHEASAKIEHDNQIIVDGSVRAAYSPQLFADWEASDTSYAMDYGRRKTFADENASSLDPTDFGKRGKFGSITFVDPVGTSKVEVNGEVSSGMVPLQAGIDKEGRLSVQGLLQGWPDLPTGPGASYPYAAVKPQASATSAGRFQPFLATKAASVEGAIRDILGESGWRQVREYASIPTSVPAYILRDLIAPQGSITVVANSVTGTGRIDAFRTSIHIQNHSNGWLVLDGMDSLADHRAGTVVLNDAKGQALRDVPASLVVNGLAKLDQKPVINVTVASSIRDEVRSTAGLIIAGAIVAPASHVTIANDNGPVIALASITAASLKLDVPNSTVVFNTPKADFATGGADTLQAGLENNGLDPQNASSANLLLPFLPGKAGSALDADYVASAAADYTLGNTTGKVVAQGSAVAIRPFLGKGITASQLYVFAKTIDVNAPLNIGKVEDFSLVLSAALGDQLRQFQLEYQNGEHDDPRYEIPGVGLEARGSKATYDARTNQISLSSVSLAHETRLLLDGRIASTMEGSAIKLLGGLQSAQGIVNQTGIPLVVNTVDAGSGGITGTVEFRDTQTQLNTRYTYASQNVVEVHTAPRGQAYADAPDRVVNAQQVDFRPASDLLYVSSLRQEIFKTAAAPGVFSSQNSAGWYPDGGWSYGDVAATGFANFQAVRTASLSSDARTLTLTNGTATVANAAWLRTPLDVSRSFMVAFRYEGSGEGDGATLALQTVGTSAIGASGGALGYSGIGGNKAAFKINLYNFRTGPYPGVAFDKNEASGGVYQAPGDVSVSNPMDVQLYYNAARREWTAFLTDTIQKTTKSIVFPIDMASHFGASKVYLGMTGSTGLAVSTQSMKDFMLAYDPQLSLPPTVPDGEFLRVAGPALAGFSGFVPANLGDGAITDDTVTFVSFNNVGNRPRAAWLGEKISTQADTLSVEFTYEAKANKNSPIDSFATFVPQSASYASAITPGQVVLTDGSQNVARAAWLNNEVRTTQDFTVDFTYQKEETTVTGFGDFVASTGTPATAITADKVTLTDGSKSIARAAWYKDQIPTNKSFVINFDYQASGNQDKLADGMALVFQTQGTSVVGRSGSSLGYVGIPGKKAAYQINVFPGSFFNGQQTGTNFVTNDTAGNYSIDRGVGWFPGWSNPDSWPIHVELVYDASSLTLTEKFSSDTAGRTGEYTNYYPNVNLASLLGPTTYLGFTGASGDTTATQTVTNFKLRLGTTLDSKDNGIALVFQKQGTGAVGANGSGLGYRGILGATAAYQINLGPNKGSNFVTTNTTGTYNSTGAIDFSSGHAIKVRLTYNSVRHELTETLTDLVSNSTYERRYPNVDLSALLGSTTYLGFTGGSGSSQAVSQVVRDLTFETHADNGVALVFQSSGTQATGNVDRGLGYVGIAGATAAYQINLNRVQTRGSNFVTSNTAGSYQSTGNVDFGSGHPIRVKLDFNKAVREVTETLTDLVSGATFRRTYQNVELASTLDPTTYVGFTTGTGGLQNWQVVKDFRLDRSAMQTGFEQRFGARLLSQGNGSSATAPTSYDTSTSWWVRADQPIQVDFSRMLLSPFSVTSNAPLTLNGLVRINTDLNLSAVGPITMSSSGLIEARSAKLVATGDEGQLGTSDNPLNVTLFEGALLAEAPQGVFIASNGDLKVDRISTLAVGKSVATAPVVLESAGSVLANAVSPGIQAGHLTIHSQGTVGSQALPLRIQLDTSIAYDGTALGGSLNVEATGDVSLLQIAGDLRVDSIKSPGTVTLRTLGGNILDGLTLDALQLNAPDLLPQMRDYLHKLFTQSSSGGAEERIAALEYQIDSAYRAYWRLVPPVNEGEVPSLWNNWDPGAWGAIVTTSDDQGNPQQVYQLSATGLETFRAYAAAANQKDVATDAEVQDYVNNLWRFCISQFADTMAFGPAWATQPQFLQYDPGFSFKASAETIAVIKAENEDRLDIRMFLSGEALTRFSEDSALSRPANIEAGQLNLQSAGSIGQNSQSRFIPLDGTLNYQMTPEEQRFLRLASEKGEIQLVGENESGDTVYFTAGRRPAGVTLTGLSVAISRPLAVQLASTGSVTAIATDEILLVGNTNDLRVKQVSSSGNGFVSLAAVQNLLAADDAAVVPVRGGALRLVADGNIGSSMRPMTFSATGKVDLSSLGNAWLRTNNSLQVGLWDVAGDLNLNAFGTGTVTDSLASQRGSFSGFTGGTGWSSSATQGSAVVTSTSVDDTLQLALEAGAGAQTAWPSQVRFQKNDLVSISDQFVLGFLYQSHATNSRVALNLGNVGQPGVAIVMNLGDAAGAGSWIDILTESGIASATSGRSPGSVVLNSGHPIQVVVSYSTLRQKLTATFTDTITQESVTIEKSDLDLVERLGGHRAKVSWHALGSGAQASSHSIQGLRFVDGPVNLVAKSLGMASGGAIGAFVDRTNSQPISMLIEGKTDIVSNGDIVVEQVLGDLTVGTIASPGTVAVTAPFGSLVTYQPIAVAARPAGADNAEGELDSPGIRGKNVFVSAREGVGAGSRSLDIDAEQFSARSSSGGVFVNCKGLEAAFVLYAVPADSPLRKQVTVEDLWSAGAVNLQCNADLVVTGEIVADSMDISAADPSQSITIVTKNVKSQRDGRLLVKLNGFGSLLLDGAQSAEGQEISVDGDRVNTSSLSVGLGEVRKLILGLGTGSNNVEVNDAAGLNFLQVLGNQGVDQVNVSNAALKIKELLFDASDENDGMHVNLNNTGAWVRKSGVETAFGKIRFAAIKQVVLDQLDTLLGPGAVQQLELIIKNFPTDRLMVVGSTGHDQLTMDSRADVLDFAVKWNGVTSNDRTFSRSEINDVLFYTLGGNDNVAITGSEPVVLDVHSGRGDDTIVVSAIPAILTDLYGNNRITAGPGDDTIHTGSGNDLVDAGDGRNLVVDDGGDNKIWTGQHDDEIQHTNPRDWINAGAGINSIWLNGSNQGWYSVSSPADVNRDGLFDSADLVLAFQAGKYENSNDWMATSDEGDWDGDGRFTSEDLVLAFQVGGYELNFVAGDCNDDGVFDSADLVLAFQTGEYEDDIGGNSTRREGDWNGDGDFTSEDMVFAFQRGYRGNAVATPADRLRASAVDAALALDE